MTELLSIITRSDGKLNSRTLNVEYFTKHNKQHLWQQLLESTKDFDHLDLRWRAQALLAGKTECPKCSCGNKVQVADGKLSEYCSNSCATKSPKKGENRRKVDEVVAAAKRKATMIANHGVEFNSQRPEVKQIIREAQTKAHEESWEKLADKEWLLNQHHNLGKSVKQVARELRIDYGIVLETYQNMEAVVHRSYHNPIAQMEATAWVESLGVEIIKDYVPGWMGKKELDIWIPSHQVAIEINGIRYHGDKDHPNARAKPRNYHLFKTEECAKRGILLLQFTDIEWELKQEIVKSIIKTRLGMSQKIYARKCVKEKITWKRAAAFLEENHIHGEGNATDNCWGLFHCGELVQVITVGAARYGHTEDNEVYRFCGKNNYVVVGGLSKLLSHVEGTILSFVDRWVGNGKGFEAVGFRKVGSTPPKHTWAKGNRTLNRERTQRGKLDALFKTKFNPDDSESDIMHSLNYWRVWNSGNLIMVKE